MSPEELAQNLLPLARRLVDEASRVALRYYGDVDWRRKAGGSAVSEADLAVQARVAELLHAERPADVLLAEEQGAAQTSTARCVWVLDPIDGTEPFIRRMPNWAVALGLLVDGQAALGVVAMPASGDVFVGGLGVPAERNGRPMQVAQPDEDLQPVIFVPASTHHWFKNFSFRGRAASLLSMAAHLCLLADGAAQAVLISHSRLWDVAGPLAILHAAGGMTRRRDGHAIDLGRMQRDGGTTGVALAGHKQYVEQLYQEWGES